MSILQLNPPLPIKTPKGRAMAHFLIDYGPENSVLWVSFQDDTGECWSWQNKDVRAQDNISYGRHPKSDIRGIKPAPQD